MLSNLELRHILESGLLPLSCHCTVNPDSSLTVEITAPGKRRPTLTVAGICSEKLTSSQAITALATGLRQDFRALEDQMQTK